jgi:hypothetical protein
MQDVGLEPRKVEPCSWEALRVAGPGRIIDLAACVFAVEPRIRARTRVHVHARALAAQAAKRAGFRPSSIADLLGVSERAARRLAARPVDPKAFAGLRRRLSLEERVRGLCRRVA